MASEIDPTVISDNAPVDKAELRALFQTAREEITALQEKVSIPYRIAFSDLEFDNL